MGKKQERAGLVPFYKTNDGKIFMMFMKPSDPKYGGDVFQIAKGRLDDGENPLEAAVREAGEELGLKEANIKWIKKCGVFLNTHHIYVAEVDSMDDSDYNKPHFETGEVSWLEPDAFFSVGRKLHIPLVKSCIKEFNQKTSDTS